MSNGDELPAGDLIFLFNFFYNFKPVYMCSGGLRGWKGGSGGHLDFIDSNKAILCSAKFLVTSYIINVFWGLNSLLGRSVFMSKRNETLVAIFS